jgi:uncharacterized protein YecE (DUF72 family)
MQLKDNYYSGISGLQLPVPKYLYPPEFQNSSRLTYYSSLFNSIEFNSTFYKIPLSKTIGRWTESVNHRFRFTFKLFKEITHLPDFQFSESDVINFLNTVEKVGEKKGCLLIQFPPKRDKQYLHRLGELLQLITEHETGKEWKLAIEFRNKSWYHEDVYDLLNQYRASMVFQDKAGSPTPLEELQSNFIYVRFHGPTGNYRGSYDEQFLREHALYIKSWLEEGKMVFAYFNNTMGDAYGNLITLNSMVYSDHEL